MYNYKTVILCVSILLIHAPTGNALKCYTCSSDRNSDCFHPTPANGIVEICGSTTLSRYVCRTLEFHDETKNKTHISRSCYLEKDKNGNDACHKARTSPHYPNVKTCHFCETDLCNTEDFKSEEKSFSIMSRSNSFLVIVGVHTILTFFS